MGMLSSTEIYHTAVIDMSGRLYTCGLNSVGQLGLSDLSNRRIFTLVNTLSNEKITQVSTSTHGLTACITSSGKLYTWGYNIDGRLGHGDLTNRTVPTLVTSLSNRNIVSVKCANFNIICLDSSGYVYSTGDIRWLNRSVTDISSTQFGRVTAGGISNETIVQIDANNQTFGVVSSTNKLYMWGERSIYGLFGDGSTTGSVGTSLDPSAILISNNSKKFTKEDVMEYCNVKGDIYV
jgi:alpha-tubulin suppressor-like RCC1 family protein